jgi:hypothetical protein
MNLSALTGLMNNSSQCFRSFEHIVHTMQPKSSTNILTKSLKWYPLRSSGFKSENPASKTKKKPSKPKLREPNLQQENRRILGLSQLKTMSKWITVINENSVVPDHLRPSRNARHDAGVGTNLSRRLDPTIKHRPDDALMDELIAHL